jgi:hypothetical protein
VRGERALDFFGSQSGGVVFHQKFVAGGENTRGQHAEDGVHSRNLAQIRVFERARQFERELYFRHFGFRIASASALWSRLGFDLPEYLAEHAEPGFHVAARHTKAPDQPPQLEFAGSRDALVYVT